MKLKINGKRIPDKNSQYRFLICKHFKFSLPCDFNKKNFIECENCKKYRKRKTPVVLIKLSSTGDVLRTTSLIKPLKEKYKDRDLYFVTEKENFPILKNLDVVSLDIGDNFVWEILRYFKFKECINLEQDFKSLLLTGIIRTEKKRGFWIDDKWKLVFYPEMAGYYWKLTSSDLKKKKNRLTYQEIVKNISGVKYYTKPLIILDETERNIGIKKIREKVIFKNSPFIGLNLGGGVRWNKKVFKKEKFLKIAKELLKKRFNVVILAGEKEKGIYLWIKRRLRKAIYPGFNNTLREFFSIINQIDLLITADTLALHIGIALNKKIISFFGPTSPYEIELYGQGKKIITDKNCKICYLRNCNKKVDCMDKIDIHRILELI